MVLIFPFLNVHGSETFLRSELDIKDFVPKLATSDLQLCKHFDILVFDARTFLKHSDTDSVWGEHNTRM